MMSQSKMALPLRTNLKHLLGFIQKFNSPKRFLCVERSAGHKVRAAAKCSLNCDVWFVGSKGRAGSLTAHRHTHIHTLTHTPTHTTVRHSGLPVSHRAAKYS